jgi:hypothetical protein
MHCRNERHSRCRLIAGRCSQVKSRVVAKSYKVIFNEEDSPAFCFRARFPLTPPSPSGRGSHFITSLNTRPLRTQSSVGLIHSRQSTLLDVFVHQTESFGTPFVEPNVKYPDAGLSH